MTSLVVDSSIIVAALLDASDDVLRRRLAEPRVLHAPHLLDFEVSHALRGLVIGGKLSLDRADEARADFADLTIERLPGAVVAERTWELRENFTAYDASYIALAELLDCPLLTGDRKLGGPHRARVAIHPLEAATQPRPLR